MNDLIYSLLNMGARFESSSNSTLNGQQKHNIVHYYVLELTLPLGLPFVCVCVCVCVRVCVCVYFSGKV